VSVLPVRCFSFSISAFYAPLRFPLFLSTAYLFYFVEPGSIHATLFKRFGDAVCLYMFLSSRMQLFLWIFLCVFYILHNLQGGIQVALQLSTYMNAQYHVINWCHEWILLQSSQCGRLHVKEIRIFSYCRVQSPSWKSMSMNTAKGISRMKPEVALPLF
jgi:hypothetical protein